MLVSTLMALMVTEIAVKVPHVRYSTCMCVFVRVSWGRRAARGASTLLRRAAPSSQLPAPQPLCSHI